MNDEIKEKLVDISILLVVFAMFAIPFSFWLVTKGFFGIVALSGKSDFSPVMDRFFLISIMFFVLYGVSWIKSKIKYRTAKVFGVAALLALLSVLAVQFDVSLLPLELEPAIKSSINLWFLNLPGYFILSISNGVTLGWQFYLSLLLFALTSFALFWDIKVELSSNWKLAFNMWWIFEIVYAIILWIVFRIMKSPMFMPIVL